MMAAYRAGPHRAGVLAQGLRLERCAREQPPLRQQLLCGAPGLAAMQSPV